MPSPDASRRNARRSTGPRTLEGKATVRLNSLSHGAFATDLLLPGEDNVSFSSLESHFIEHYRPSTPAETLLVNRMILASWRLLRLAAMESRILRAHIACAKTDAGLIESIGNFIRGASAPPAPPPEETGDSDSIALAWIRDSNSSNTLVKLVRYQAFLERSFYRALHEFERLRSGGAQ